MSIYAYRYLTTSCNLRYSAPNPEHFLAESYDFFGQHPCFSKFKTAKNSNELKHLLNNKALSVLTRNGFDKETADTIVVHTLVIMGAYQLIFEHFKSSLV